MKLYHFHWDCGRMGDLNGIFVVSIRGEKILQALVGQEVNFGEALGKHSEVYGTLEAKELEAAEATSEDIATVCRVLRKPLGLRDWVTLSGYNPLDYIENTSETLFDELLEKAGLSVVGRS